MLSRTLSISPSKNTRHLLSSPPLFFSLSPLVLFPWSPRILSLVISRSCYLFLLLSQLCLRLSLYRVFFSPLFFFGCFAYRKGLYGPTIDISAHLSLSVYYISILYYIAIATPTYKSYTHAHDIHRTAPPRTTHALHMPCHTDTDTDLDADYYYRLQTTDYRLQDYRLVRTEPKKRLANRDRTFFDSAPLPPPLTLSLTIGTWLTITLVAII